MDDESDLIESSKSPASIAWSNKQWVGTCLYQEWYKSLLISCEAAFGYEQVAKRIANIRLTVELSLFSAYYTHPEIPARVGGYF